MTSLPSYHVGIIGATGAVGQEIIHVLKVRQFPLASLRLFASAHSVGKVHDGIVLEAFDMDTVSALDVVFLAVSGEFALQYAQELAQTASGPLVIDNSSAFRCDPTIPLMIPEINAAMGRGHRLISNPNCTTAIAAMALWPLHCTYGIKKIILSTYQAASGAGAQVRDDGKRSKGQDEGIVGHVGIESRNSTNA